jgi:hypothetical protein
MPPPPIMMTNPGNMMCPPGQAMYVLVPNPMMMAPYYGEPMQQPPMLEQQQFDVPQGGYAAFNSQASAPPAIYWPNHQAY